MDYLKAIKSYTEKVCSQVYSKDKAEKDLDQCLKDLPERQWGICERRYYKAIAKC